MGSDGFQRLCDLLDHERHQATVDLSLQLGSSGRVRRFRVGGITENENSEFYDPPLRRMLTRFRLWLRGYRFGESEVVDRWTDAVYADIEPLLPGLLQLVSHVEFYLAALAFQKYCTTRGLAVSLPEIAEGGEHVLEDVFNPAALRAGRDARAVYDPLAREGGHHAGHRAQLGGKTRLLQAIGLTQMLAQVGFFVPRHARGCDAFRGSSARWCRKRRSIRRRAASARSFSGSASSSSAPVPVRS